MAEQNPLLSEYLPLFTTEYQRIGFTDDDFRYLGSGGEITEEGLLADLDALRRVPSGIGAVAYYARFGVDFAALKREAEQRASEWDAT